MVRLARSSFHLPQRSGSGLLKNRSRISRIEWRPVWVVSAMLALMRELIGATGMSTVASQLRSLASIAAILTTVLLAFGRDTVARRMSALVSFSHGCGHLSRTSDGCPVETFPDSSREGSGTRAGAEIGQLM